jgi:hypothetical protein
MPHDSPPFASYGWILEPEHETKKFNWKYNITHDRMYIFVSYQGRT